MYKLYLDDIRDPRNTYPTTSNSEWVIARSYDEFVKTIETKGMPFLISFDHDLGKEHYIGASLGKPIDYSKYTEKTGMDCVKWLVNYCMDNFAVRFPVCNVHSANPIGAENMTAYIESYERSIGK